MTKKIAQTKPAPAEDPWKHLRMAILILSLYFFGYRLYGPAVYKSFKGLRSPSCRLESGNSQYHLSTGRGATCTFNAKEGEVFYIKKLPPDFWSALGVACGCTFAVILCGHLLWRSFSRRGNKTAEIAMNATVGNPQAKSSSSTQQTPKDPSTPISTEIPRKTRKPSGSRYEMKARKSVSAVAAFLTCFANGGLSLIFLLYTLGPGRLPQNTAASILGLFLAQCLSCLLFSYIVYMQVAQVHNSLLARHRRDKGSELLKEVNGTARQLEMGYNVINARLRKLEALQTTDSCKPGGEGQ